MSILVTNNAQKQIEVSINKWGNEGNTDNFSIPPGKTEKWDRSDERGFIMVVKKTANRLPYYIRFDSNIIVSDDKVAVNGTTIMPLS